MEVITPSPSTEFHFDSASTSPFISAPGSPQPFGNLFYSAPTSPTRVSAFYTEFHHFSAAGTCDSPTVIPRISKDHDDDDDEFEFNFGGQLDNTSINSVSAEELFHGGQIKPNFKQVVDDLQKSHESPPVEIERENLFVKKEGERKYRGSRSLPRFRISDMLLEKTTDSSSSSKWGWKGWRLKDILLFRSASEGRVMGKLKQYPLKKYELLKKVTESESVSSFRSSESSKRGPATAMSAHEIHYTANRAASEEMKRRTFLPYKQTLLGGCLGFNPAVHDRHAGSFGLSTRG
ncbi:uncharacterized protein LOC124942853 [Impatiens glandulifera]|uniref:uncharacterized protein LOC124942853 n=1 Tax=Impatiens glandulifera TaxID=253017 RepID=UPI001FB08E44|nr:uncharacterized protein LOC124942853 [Impatiens glandulifera]